MTWYQMILCILKVPRTEKPPIKKKEHEPCLKKNGVGMLAGEFATASKTKKTASTGDMYKRLFNTRQGHFNDKTRNN
jgi:hypothetical protein